MDPLSERRTRNQALAPQKNSASGMVTACSHDCENAEKAATYCNNDFFCRGLLFKLAGRPRGRPLWVEDGNREMELRSLTHFALDQDAAAVNFDKMFGDGEPQPGAADFAGTSHINAVEALEDARLVRLWDADAGVGNRKGYFGAVRGSADHDLAA